MNISETFKQYINLTVIVLVAFLMIVISIALHEEGYGAEGISSLGKSVTKSIPSGTCQGKFDWLMNRPGVTLASTDPTILMTTSEIAGVGGFIETTCDWPCTLYGPMNCWIHYENCPTKQCDPVMPKREVHLFCQYCCSDEAWCHECWWEMEDNWCEYC